MSEERAIAAVKAALLAQLDALIGTSGRDLVEQRYARFRAFGDFTEGDAGGRAGTAA